MRDIFPLEFQTFYTTIYLQELNAQNSQSNTIMNEDTIRKKTNKRFHNNLINAMKQPTGDTLTEPNIFIIAGGIGCPVYLKDDLFYTVSMHGKAMILYEAVLVGISTFPAGPEINCSPNLLKLIDILLSKLAPGSTIDPNLKQAIMAQSKTREAKLKRIAGVTEPMLRSDDADCGEFD